MPAHPPRLSHEQVRRLAKDLLRDLKDGDRAAIRRLAVVSAPSTLAGAQLAIAREYGFPSWARLKRDVELREILDSLDVGCLRALVAEQPDLALTTMGSRPSEPSRGSRHCRRRGGQLTFRPRRPTSSMPSTIGSPSQGGASCPSGSRRRRTPTDSRSHYRKRLQWRARQDSNLRPSAPEADALSTELQARGPRSYLPNVDCRGRRSGPRAIDVSVMLDRSISRGGAS